jgi:serine/threonine protein kinase
VTTAHNERPRIDNPIGQWYRTFGIAGGGAIGGYIRAPTSVTVAKPAVQTFGKYQILERIATGGMAEIYKARLEGIGGFQRTFAIKRILPHLSTNQEYIAMLVDEAKVSGLLSHANIVQILDLGQVGDIWYIAMEYVDGRDLGAILRRARERGLCLPVPHTVFIALELLKGLEYAHQRQVMRGGRAVPLNIVHRDISPPNVLLSFQGEVKLTDFGIARASHKVLETQSGIIKGRYDYMSPEQAAASELDQRSDLFAVGVVLYEMLTGEHPFRTETEFGTLERIRTGRYVAASKRNPDVPRALDALLDRALRVAREERYPSATAFKEALDRFFQDSGFIFTQNTLASYARGLFPDIRHSTTGASLPPLDRQVLLAADTGPDDLELPEVEALPATLRLKVPKRDPVPPPTPTPPPIPVAATEPAPSRWPGRSFAALIGVALGLGVGWAAFAPDRLGTLRIEVAAPATAWVNDQRISDEVRVPAGTPQRVRVEFPGRAAWERTFTLRPGEHRVLILAPAPHLEEAKRP